MLLPGMSSTETNARTPSISRASRASTVILALACVLRTRAAYSSPIMGGISSVYLIGWKEQRQGKMSQENPAQAKTLNGFVVKSN